MSDSIEDRVIAILAEQALLDPSEVRPDAKLADLGIDSLGLVEVVFALEEAFDVQIPFNSNDPGASEFDVSTVGTMAQAMESLIAAQKQA